MAFPYPLINIVTEVMENVGELKLPLQPVR